MNSEVVLYTYFLETLIVQHLGVFPETLTLVLQRPSCHGVLVCCKTESLTIPDRK